LAKALTEHGAIEAFFAQFVPADRGLAPALQGFSETLVSHVPETPPRLRKHLARPGTGSACKRLVMYLRWMVRSGPVDLGLWTALTPAQLALPLDVHSGRQARALGLLTRKQDDWRAVGELTEACRQLDPADPARYDYALFGIGANGDSLDPAFVKQAP